MLPLIITAIILAVQNLKAMSAGGAKLARLAVFWYVGTTIMAVTHSMILVDLVWRKLMVVASKETLAETSDTADGLAEDGEGTAPHDVVVTVFESFVPSNIFDALANSELLSVLVAAIVVGALIKPTNSSLLRGIREVDRIVFVIISFLIKLAPIGVFFLILANLMTLDMKDIGVNLGVLIGGKWIRPLMEKRLISSHSPASVTHMCIQIFVIIPIIFVSIVRKNPYTYWLSNSPAWVTAWVSRSFCRSTPPRASRADTLRSRAPPPLPPPCPSPCAASRTAASPTRSPGSARPSAPSSTWTARVSTSPSSSSSSPSRKASISTPATTPSLCCWPYCLPSPPRPSPAPRWS